ncbi:YALI0F01881p [Yarrowia lipolytica CLIB122]|uniref:Dynactin subunit 4 n=2 Tax=Yarrowia lipolytica TaxID=4952 RepID=Q6C382_YARLI|nr:YALI0F01881p [Yarrowia lipolytica CLIB122]AOW06510.1 hypothetical protein YALI1_F02942g [Yarrowia lipolytica]KAB8282171.1 hypothetical protein BKA91DRAFT_139026 [Yarrowia lipolytica]KAE8171970.1 hypothetical protein BKA90DRAFT_138054 [Yarrowia lipolytica]KAJ8056238.1 hypothetical protein LXG23DRAFT_48153 [Yarrowia lipolytica]RMI94878.1 hypothetical protein BD777DRAFT_130941 [Yarrowia lipolytica]|eukprot:XP_504880.1 YALI0F01881p [Yarrowia lipolytica CLIB122]
MHTPPMIHCCNESIVAESGSTTVSDISVPHSLAQKWTLFEREKLYFCKTCQLLQSPDMTTDIVECIYCPMCLVEVPKSSTQRVCTRNCLQCPECKSALDVMKTSKEASNYTLKCTWCEYTTDQYVSDKALAAQILQQQNTLGDNALAGATRKYIRHLFEPEDKDASKAMEALSVGSSRGSDLSKSLKNTGKIVIDVNKRQSERTELKPPILPSLRGKKSRLCYKCEKPLIVPSKKPSSISLKASELAIHYIPEVKLLSFNAQGVKFRARNVLREEVVFSVSTANLDSEDSPHLKDLFPSGATVLTPSTTLNPSVDLLTADDTAFACSFPVETMKDSIFKTKLVMNDTHKGVKPSWDDLEIELEQPEAKRLAVYIHCKSKTLDVGYWLVFDRPEEKEHTGKETEKDQEQEGV